MSQPVARWVQRLATYRSCLAQLTELVERSASCRLSDFEKFVLVQHFTGTYQRAWHLLKDFFNHQGNHPPIHGPRDAFELAARQGIISRADVLLESIKSRQLAVDACDEHVASQIVRAVVGCGHAAYVELAERMSAQKRQADQAFVGSASSRQCTDVARGAFSQQPHPRWVRRLASYQVLVARLGASLQEVAEAKPSAAQKRQLVAGFVDTHRQAVELLNDFFYYLGDIPVADPRALFQMAFKRRLLNYPQASMLVKSVKIDNDHAGNAQIAAKVAPDAIGRCHFAYAQLAQIMSAQKVRRGM